MLITIYQINKDRDVNDRMFMPYNKEKFDFSSYDKVYSYIACRQPSAENGYKVIADENDIYDVLESVFSNFNHPGKIPTDYEGRSLSVSDVVEVDNEYYYCASVGFKKINVKRA